jgi:hypothetical protein
MTLLMRREALAALAALLLVTSSTAGTQQLSPDRPNVVLIMTDDAGYADTGSYGAPDIRTPNIDSLARDGVKLTDFYANAMSCTPTRAGLIPDGIARYESSRVTAARPSGSDGGCCPGAFAAAVDEKNDTRPRSLQWHLGYVSSRPVLRFHFFGYKSAAIDYYTHFTTGKEGAQFVSAQPIREDDTPSNRMATTDPSAQTSSTRMRHGRSLRCRSTPHTARPATR